MKALKEKRISLRSLWRRGLVILSLFALVFASCSDSSSGGSSSSNGPRAIGFAIVSGPTNNQYMGQEVDLTGLVVYVRTAEGGSRTVRYEDEPDKFTTNPRVVTGWDYTKGTWGLSEYFLYDLIYEGLHSDRALDFSGGDGIVYPIITDVVWDTIYAKLVSNAAGGGMNIEGPKTMGLNVTGTVNQTVAYEDDDIFDFSGLELWADYLTDDDVLKWLYFDDPMPTKNDFVWVPKIEKRPVPFSNVTWAIRPRYEKGVRPSGGVYDGYVWITVGQDFRYERNYDWYSEWSPGMGVSTPVRLEKVYTVSDAKAITLKVNPEVEEQLYNYFYWQENTKAAWIDRMGKDAYLEVTYNDGGPAKTKYIQDLKNKSDIYLNSDPGQGSIDDWDEEGVYLGDRDFDIMTIKYPITKKSADLGIILYYRGAQDYVPINVFTVLKAVTADVDPVQFWPDPKWDNDVDNGEGGPLELSRRLNVKATYQAINNADLQKDIDLVYFFDKAKSSLWYPSLERRWDGTSAVNPVTNLPTFWQVGWGTGPYYIFSKEAADTDDDADYVDSNSLISGYEDYRVGGIQYVGDDTYVKGYQKYLNNQQKKGKDAVTTTKVTVRHFVSVAEIADYYNWKFCYDNDWPYYAGTTAASNPWPYDNTVRPSQYSAVVGNTVGSAAMEAAYRNSLTWSNGLLPNSWNIYVSTATKGPWSNKGRNLGPKVSQTKKAKVTVNWVNGYN